MKLKALKENKGSVTITDGDMTTLLAPGETCECTLNATIATECEGDGVAVDEYTDHLG